MNKILRKYKFIFWLFAILSTGCDGDNKGELVPLTYQDTLDFLVANSDLIAIASLSGGSDEPKLSLFSRLPEEVDANILSIIKGEEDKQKINISYTPKHLRPNTIESIIILRNGKHIVFLSKDGQSYYPTTASSLLRITHSNRVFPIWRPDQYKEIGPDGSKRSSGIDLNKIIDEITTEINRITQPHKTIKRH